jgi:multidrug efflux pump subunit AcrA (membrane-fusion protein)
MSTRLDTCMEALRSLARSSELEANRLPTAELRIRDFLTPVGTNRAAQRAALEELDNAVSREAELRPREASFWQAISDFGTRPFCEPLQSSGYAIGAAQRPVSRTAALSEALSSAPSGERSAKDRSRYQID